MSELLGTAFVSIQSELAKGFRANLRAQVLKAAGDGIRVPIHADIKPFRAQLIKEARKAPILVPVMPDIKVGKFRAELAAKVRQAARGVTVNVPVNVATGGRGGTTGGGRGAGGGTAGQTRDQQRLTDAIGRTAQAEGLLARAREQGLSTGLQVDRLNLAMAKSEASIAQLLREEATARAANNTVLADSIAKQRARIEALHGEAAAQRLSIQSNRQQSLLINQVNDAKARANALLAVELGTIKSRDRLAAHSNELLAVEKELRDLGRASKNADLGALERETAALLQNTQAREAAIVKRRQELIAAERGATRRAQGLRGGAATGLSAAGLRGATLAAGGPFLAGAAAATIGVEAVRSAARLEEELNVLRITARATASEMAAVRAEAIALGRDVSLPAVTATDAAQAMNQLVRAGLSVENAIAGARGVLQLATAAQLDFATATNLTASALNAFQLSGDEAVHVADVFTNAANASQASIEEMGISLQQAAAAAAITGISFEDTVALLTLLSRAGLRGSDAGTSLRTALIRLVNPTKEASGVIKQLGLDVRDSQGAIRPEVFGEFAEATQNLTRQQRQQAAAIIFGADAFRTIAITSREGVAGLNEVRGELDRTGAAAELAGARAIGFSGKLSALISNVQTLGTTLGNLTLGPLSLVVDGMNLLVQSANTGASALATLKKEADGLGAALSDALPGPVSDFLSEAGDIGKGFLGPQAGFTLTLREIGRWRNKFAEEAEEVRGDAKETAKDIQALFDTVGRGPLKERVLNDVLFSLDAMADKLATGDVEAQRLAQSIREMIREITQTQQLPPVSVDLELKLDKNKARTDAMATGETVLQAFQAIGPQFRETGLFYLRNLEEGMKEGVTKIDFGQIATGISLETQRLLAEAAGDEAGQLSALRARLAATRRTKARQQALVTTTRPDLEDELQATIQQEIQLEAAIQSILDAQRTRREAAARNAEDAAKKAQSAQEKRDQAILAAFSLAQQGVVNRLEVAQATAGLADDIKATIALRKLIIKQRDSLRDRIKTHELRVAARQEYNQRLFELGQELQQLRLERAKTIQEEIRRGIELDIEFAETTENVAAERRARLRLIKSLQAEANALRDVKKKTIEQKNRLKEIRNEIAQQRKELQEITQDRRRMFAEMSFAFLTTQQGFFANVAGNLLPGFATKGTVGTGPFGGGPGLSGTASVPSGGTNIAAAIASTGGAQGAAALRERGFGPQDALDEGSRRQQAGAAGGFTAAQAATLIHLTTQIVKLLGGVESRTRHPESKNSARTGGTSMDAM